MLKLLLYILEKLEFRLSKKENKVGKKENISSKLKLYREMIDSIDSYNNNNILRHYRYFELKIDDIEVNHVKDKR